MEGPGNQTVMHGTTAKVRFKLILKLGRDFRLLLLQGSHCILGGCIVNAPLNLPKMQWPLYPDPRTDCGRSGFSLVHLDHGGQSSHLNTVSAKKLNI